MPRRTAMFGICLLMSMTAIASSAFAEATPDRFTSQTYPVTVHGSEPHGNTTIITEAGTWTCDHTVHGELSQASQTLTLKPTFTNCTWNGFPGSVAVEGCDYLYHVTTRVAADKYRAHMDIVCPEGKSIKVTAATCKFEIPGQTGLTTVDFDDMTTSPQSLNDLTITDTAAGTTYKVTQDGFGCPFSGTGHKTGAEFISHQPLTLKGFIPGGPQQAIHIG